MIELNQVSKSFDGRNIFRDFSYRFEEGKTYALVGPSGSGKTTLLNIIGKLETLDDGTVLINNMSLAKIKEKDYFKSYISYLFQNYGLIENRTIKENLDLAFIGKKLSSKERLEQMSAALKVVHLSLDINRKIFSLSGGESQRVAIAKTMLKGSPIILADEPTASLDEKNSEDVINLILSLKNQNRIIIVATHSPAVYDKMDHIITIGG